LAIEEIIRLVELAIENFELNFDGIFKGCLRDPDAEVRSQAIEGLWENEEPSLIEPLIQLLEQDSSEKVQATAATALSRFALLAEYQKLDSSHTARLSQSLLSVVHDKGRPLEVRRRALEAAAPLNIPQVKEAIRECYDSHNPGLKVSSLYAMGRNCDPAWLPILLKELSNPDPEIRYEAAGACGELEEAEAVPYVAQLIHDPDIEVQLAAIQTLGKIGGAQAKACLRECLDNPSQAIREAADQALRELVAGEDPLSFRL